MKFLGFNIITDRELTKIVQDGAASLADRKASSILKRWAANPECLTAAFAARHRLRPDHAFVTDALLEVECRGVVAFAEAMGRERGEVST